MKNLLNFSKLAEKNGFSDFKVENIIKGVAKMVLKAPWAVGQGVPNASKCPQKVKKKNQNHWAKWLECSKKGEKNNFWRFKDTLDLISELLDLQNQTQVTILQIWRNTGNKHLHLKLH